MSVKWDESSKSIIETYIMVFTQGRDVLFLRPSLMASGPIQHFHASFPESILLVHVLQLPQFSCKRLIARLNVEES